MANRSRPDTLRPDVIGPEGARFSSVVVLPAAEKLVAVWLIGRRGQAATR